MTVQIPRECTHNFKDFFADFDNDLEMLDIQTYGISVTTLEQVFLEIGHDPNPKPKINSGVTPSNSAEKFSNNQGDEHLNTPSVNDDGTDLGKGLNMRGDTKMTRNLTPNADGSAPNSDRRLVDNNKAGSFLPPIDSNQKGFNNEDNLNNADMSAIAGREDSVSAMNAEAMIEEEGKTPQTPQKEKKSNPQDLVAEAGVTKTDALREVSNEKFEKFSLAESPLNTSFCNNFTAVLIKRFNSYKRSKRRLFTEIFLPSAFMIFGVWISSLDFSFRSPSRLLEPSLYPLK